ncbi:uncharacterized protein LOC132037220 [Lycium ferocissimum]|uniref:uncharacterized protein LOC132037220 n=1 Tax=Lycium ferocissimum TaxID=112874 RepID=UPI00281514BE|nr:uncharacterized protein LOC132037220 [Lycium ferocissimum]XP_059283680.1 uncharacterized protein LOC132037220 [Lycium ferocissimum]XP_059283681.1 uncharacterized protein LOC132037220 [Lycium ferocissimum]XP_059283682.1 uncharacterized protein LOC132037220 [Lycium ferocissimum]XP_059283683.1 uncharacterized protein LOC132037220 [Lycium ferocissimum]XP_059283684.1 uncharacterized protein LOC132037220 [Lycium ferocissimum]
MQVLSSLSSVTSALDVKVKNIVKKLILLEVGYVLSCAVAEPHRAESVRPNPLGGKKHCFYKVGSIILLSEHAPSFVSQAAGFKTLCADTIEREDHLTSLQSTF